MECVRCLGNHNADRRAAMPRAHHKFLVFCDHIEGRVKQLPDGGPIYRVGPSGPPQGLDGLLQPFESEPESSSLPLQGF